MKTAREVWLTQLLLCVCCFMFFGSGAARAEITPYLQSPTENSIWVSWKTASGTESRVEYGLAENALTETAPGGTQALDSNYLYHTSQLTGLNADTFYYYRVVTGSETSAVYRFKTPVSAGTNNGHLRILVLGDHQIRNEDRYKKLVAAAKLKLEGLYGGPLEERVNLVLNDGDQVDVGTLDHYENLHFAQSAPISPNLPIMTAVGNHEYYYDGELANYRAHFVYDGLSYQGIPGAADESYYAYQIGRVLFIHMNSMRADATQQQWLSQVVAAADADNSTDWIISVIHHPYQAEQYIGDISTALRNSWMDILTSSRKHVLNIGGHHHLYARGQTRDRASYHMISGGTAWDQYWGQSNEQDYDDVQKTISNWAWQIIDIDIARREMSVNTYAEAHPILYRESGQQMHYNSRLIDSFRRKLDGGVPDRPRIVSLIPDPVTLPFTFVSSAFSSGDNEQLNSTQFQIASDSNFVDLKVDRIRDFENIYGDTGAPLYEPVDIHQGVDILKWDLPRYGLPNGDYYLRVRHRDRNIEWSEWSDPVVFTVAGSTAGEPGIRVDKSLYQSGEDVMVTYESGYGNPTDWLGIYRKGEVPGISGSVQWQYVPSASGVATFSNLPDGDYFVGFFADDGHTEIAERAEFYLGSIAKLAVDRTHYAEGEAVGISWSGAPGGEKDWIGIYRVGDTPGSGSSTAWSYTPETSGSVDFTGLGKGYYFAAFFINDGYTEVSARVPFSVGEEIAELSLDKNQFESGEAIAVHFSGGPGHPKDYIGLFAKGAIPGQTGSELVAYEYFDGAVSGSVTFSGTYPEGDYFMAMYHNDSYDQVSNRVCLTIGSAQTAYDCGAGSEEATLSAEKDSYIKGEQLVFTWSGSSGNPKDWVGIYRQGQEPGSVGSTLWQYLSGSSGSLEFSGLDIGDYYAVIMLDDGYTEATGRVAFSVVAATLAGDVDGNGLVDRDDRKLLHSAVGYCAGSEQFVASADQDGDNCISKGDFSLWKQLAKQQRRNSKTDGS